MRGGLVGDQDRRLLGEADRDLDALQLAARERGEAAVGELVHAGALERPLDGVAVVAGRAAERPDVRRAAERDRLAHGDARGHGRALGDERAQAGEPAAAQLAERRAAPADVAGG